MEEMRIGEISKVRVGEDKQPTLEEVLASQPLNPLRQFEFRVLPLYESKPIE